MKTRYKITVTEMTPFNVKDVQYEADDGKIYRSQYGIPEGVKWKKVSFETGEEKTAEREVYTQEVEEDVFDLKSVITAANRLQ